MKKDVEPKELLEIIANYDEDIWNNPSKWTKKEWHMWNLYLYYSGISFFKRLKLNFKLKKAARKGKK